MEKTLRDSLRKGVPWTTFHVISPKASVQGPSEFNCWIDPVLPKWPVLIELPGIITVTEP